MHFRIAVNFAGRCLEDLRSAAFCHAQQVDRTQHADLHGLDWIVLVVAGRRRTGEIVNFVNFQQDRSHDVVSNQFKVSFFEQMNHIRFLAREKVVQADNVMPLFDESFTEM